MGTVAIRKISHYDKQISEKICGSLLNQSTVSVDLWYFFKWKCFLKLHILHEFYFAVSSNIDNNERRESAYDTLTLPFEVH